MKNVIDFGHFMSLALTDQESSKNHYEYQSFRLTPEMILNHTISRSSIIKAHLILDPELKKHQEIDAPDFSIPKMDLWVDHRTILFLEKIYQMNIRAGDRECIAIILAMYSKDLDTTLNLKFQSQPEVYLNSDLKQMIIGRFQSLFRFHLIYRTILYILLYCSFNMYKNLIFNILSFLLYMIAILGLLDPFIIMLRVNYINKRIQIGNCLGAALKTKKSVGYGYIEISQNMGILHATWTPFDTDRTLKLNCQEVTMLYFHMVMSCGGTCLAKLIN